MAREYLAKLAGELLSGTNNYFLPIEAVADVHAARKKGKADIIEEIEKWRDDVDNEMHFCSSCSGPIRRAVAHTFEPPSQDRLITIIDDRYGPVAGIFDPWSPAR